MAESRQLKIGDSVDIDVPWADAEFPNCRGKVADTRHGGSVALVDTGGGRPLRVLHLKYIERVAA